MNESEKIEQAERNFDRMVVAINEQGSSTDHVGFKDHLCAFLASARSVQQYALEEAKKNPGGEMWYENYARSSNILKFFKITRDFEIHLEPVSLNNDLIVKLGGAVGENVPCTSKATFWFARNWYTRQARDYKPADKQLCKSLIQSKDVMALCQDYLNELKGFVADGIKKSFVTG